VDPDAPLTETGSETDKVVETRDYYPFGLRMPGRSTTEGTPAVEDYTGHELDAETGMLYAGARYYMSALGRWTTVDPLADDYPAWSPYNYSMNNPVNLVDPDGMAACDIELCGQNGSSITIETDAVDVSVDVSSLPGTDFGGNYTLSGRDVVLAGLDLAGIADPSGVADVAAGVMYAESGSWGNAALSGLGVVPYLGDLGKLGRVGKHLDTFGDAIKAGNRLRKSINSVTDVKGLKGLTRKTDDLSSGGGHYESNFGNAGEVARSLVGDGFETFKKGAKGNLRGMGTLDNGTQVKHYVSPKNGPTVEVISPNGVNNKFRISEN